MEQVKRPSSKTYSHHRLHKHFCLGLSLFLFLSLLSACSGEEGTALKNTTAVVTTNTPVFPTSTSTLKPGSLDDTAITSKVTLIFWQGIEGANNVALLNKKIAEFNHMHPNIEVIMVSYGNGAADQVQKQLDLALTSKRGPDLMWWGPQEFGRYADAGYLIPAQTFIDQDKDFVKNDIYQGLLDSSSYKGQIWTVPFDANCLAVYYNKTLFKQAGITQLPATWEEFSQVAQKLTNKANGITGFMVPFGQAEWSVWTYQTALWQAGGAILDATQSHATFNSSAGVKALKWWKSMLESGSATLSDVEEGYKLDDFVSGKVAMMINGPWNYNDLKKQTSVDYGVIALPKETVEATNIGGESLYLFKNSDHNKELAEWIFAKYILSPQFQVDWAIGTGYLPVSLAAVHSQVYQQFLMDNDFIRLYQAQMAVGRSRPTTPAYHAVSQTLGQAIERYLSGLESDPKKVLDQAAQQADQALAKQNITK